MNTKFFGTDGITSTSANHLANIAKEYVAGCLAKIKNINFLTEEVSVNGAKPITTKIGIDPDEVMDNLNKIAKFNSFIAYIREAIKAKNDMIDGVETCNSYIHRNYKDLESFDYEVEEITIEDAFADLSIKEQAEYYRLNAYCAAIGKTIHVDGTFHNAREKMYNALSNPAIVSETKITTFTPTVDCEKVDKVFFELQKKHRENEARLNAIKHSLEEKVRLVNKERNEEMIAKKAKFSDMREKAIDEYNAFAKAERARIGALKIIIPNDLKETYDFLTNL